jgi:hypothetical protein
LPRMLIFGYRTSGSSAPPLKVSRPCHSPVANFKVRGSGPHFLKVSRWGWPRHTQKLALRDLAGKQRASLASVAQSAPVRQLAGLESAIMRLPSTIFTLNMAQNGSSSVDASGLDFVAGELTATSALEMPVVACGTSSSLNGSMDFPQAPSVQASTSLRPASSRASVLTASPADLWPASIRASFRTSTRSCDSNLWPSSSPASLRTSSSPAKLWPFRTMRISGLLRASMQPSSLRPQTSECCDCYWARLRSWRVHGDQRA